MERRHFLVEDYYKKTSDDRVHYWPRLFDCVGRSLRSTEGVLDSDLEKGFTQFFEWRLKEKDPVELQDFCSWLESECLDAEWRLDAYSRILNFRGDHKLQTQEQGLSYSHELESLVTLLPKHPAEVVKCFAKLTDNLSGQYIYLPTEYIQTILKAGINSDDQNVHANAHHARDNLLRAGYSIDIE